MLPNLRPVLLGFLGLLLCSGVGAAPRAVFDTLRQNFGRVAQGEVVTQTFRLRNEGDSPLLIQQAKFSMPGMRIRVRQQLAPGESVELTVQWDTRGYSREVEGQTLLRLNDPAQPQVVLTSIGEVQAPIEVLPQPALYLSQYRGEPASGSLEIRTNLAAPLQITQLQPKGTHFQASLETLEAGKRYKLLVQVPADTPVGRYREAVLLHTDDPARPRLNIEVNALVKANVHISPESVDFGELSLSRLQRQPGMLDLVRHTLIVRNREGAMRITGLASDLAILQLEQTPQSAAQAFRVEVGLDPAQLRPGPLNGVIELRTDNPEMARLSIPVSGRILP